jgi:hypothetical protein
MATLKLERTVALAKEAQRVTDYYEQSVISNYQALIDRHSLPLETHIQKDGENSREWELHYWKQQAKSMMRATAQNPTQSTRHLFS